MRSNQTNLENFFNSESNVLDLSHQKIHRDEEIHQILQFVKDRKIAHLILTQTQLQSPHVKIMAEWLINLPHLISLLLNNNDIGHGYTSLDNLIKNGRSLLLLDISGNEINDEGAKDIARGLLHNSTLKQLIIQNNKIRSEGIRYLTSSLSKNTALFNLDLNDNYLLSQNIPHLKKLLGTNYTLTQLGVRSYIGEIPPADKKIIDECLARNVKFLKNYDKEILRRMYTFLLSCIHLSRTNIDERTLPVLPLELIVLIMRQMTPDNSYKLIPVRVTPNFFQGITEFILNNSDSLLSSPKAPFRLTYSENTGMCQLTFFNAKRPVKTNVVDFQNKIEKPKKKHFSRCVIS